MSTATVKSLLPIKTREDCERILAKGRNKTDRPLGKKHPPYRLARRGVRHPLLHDRRGNVAP